MTTYTNCRLTTPTYTMWRPIPTLQANATGRSAKSVREYLEKNYSPEAVKTRDSTTMLAIKALLEVVQSGSKNMEVAVMEKGKTLEVRLISFQFSWSSICSYRISTHSDMCYNTQKRQAHIYMYTLSLSLSYTHHTHTPHMSTVPRLWSNWPLCEADREGERGRGWEKEGQEECHCVINNSSYLQYYLSW